MPATYASTDLLSLFNRYAGRPTTDAAISDASKYARLAEAQIAVIEDIAARAPYVLYQKVGYSSMPTMTTTDNQVFTFGTDVNGDPLFPTGKVQIFPSLGSIPDYPWQPGYDYLDEGSQIRIPNNTTYSGTLYWRGIAPVLPISSTNQPSLIPPPSRVLIVFRAVEEFGREANRNPALADRMAVNYARDFVKWMLIYKTQFVGGGAIAPLSGGTFGPAWVGGMSTF